MRLWRWRWVFPDARWNMRGTGREYARRFRAEAGQPATRPSSRPSRTPQRTAGPRRVALYAAAEQIASKLALYIYTSQGNGFGTAAAWININSLNTNPTMGAGGDTPFFWLQGDGLTPPRARSGGRGGPPGQGARADGAGLPARAVQPKRLIAAPGPGGRGRARRGSPSGRGPRAHVVRSRTASARGAAGR